MIAVFMLVAVAIVAVHALPIDAKDAKAQTHALMDHLYKQLGGDFSREELSEMPLELALRLLAGPQTPHDILEHREAMALLEPDNFHVPTGFTAVGVCSCVFVSGIDESTCVSEDGSGAARPCTVVVDYDNQWVEATITGSMPPQTYRAIFRGPTLVTLSLSLSLSLSLFFFTHSLQIWRRAAR